MLTIGVSVRTGIAVVGSSDGSYYGSTGRPLHSLKNPVAARFSPNLGLEPCPTCLLLQSNEVLQDRHDLQPSLHHAPTPTVPLETSYADPLISHPKPTPTLPTTRIAELPPASTSVAAESSSFIAHHSSTGRFDARGFRNTAPESVLLHHRTRLHPQHHDIAS